MARNKEKAHHVCPWYMAYLFDNPLRPLIHDPVRILGDFVKPGMTVLDIGCGMGFFSLGMAKMVGPEGKVISLDLQDQMLRVLAGRARRKGLSGIIEGRLITESGFPVDDSVDFALCFWMVHEVPDQASFFRELGQVLKPGKNTLIAEPSMHVEVAALDETVRIAGAQGFSEVHRPKIRMSQAVVLKRIEY